MQLVLSFGSFISARFCQLDQLCRHYALRCGRLFSSLVGRGKRAQRGDSTTGLERLYPLTNNLQRYTGLVNAKANGCQASTSQRGAPIVSTHLIETLFHVQPASNYGLLSELVTKKRPFYQGIIILLLYLLAVVPTVVAKYNRTTIN